MLTHPWMFWQWQLYGRDFTGIGSFNRFSSGEVAASARPVSYIPCVGRYVGIDPNCEWCLRSNFGFLHGVSSGAIFSITEPSAATGYIVKVMSKWGDADPPPLSQTGQLFYFELPDDFFSRKAVIIDNMNVKHLTVRQQ